jgi:uncharacterized protein (TIGR02421 family)
MPFVGKDLLLPYDRYLKRCQAQLNLLGWTTPRNLVSTQRRFFRKQPFNPRFHYQVGRRKALHVLQQLQRLKLPSAEIFRPLRAKRKELILLARAVPHIGSKRFFDRVARLYPYPNQQLVHFARRALPLAVAAEQHAVQRYRASEVAAAFSSHLKKLGLLHWKVRLREGIAARVVVAPKKREIYVRRQVKPFSLPLSRLLAHEIDVHVLRIENGLQQPLRLFAYGFARYQTTEEGLAVLAESQLADAIPQVPAARFLLRVLAIHYARRHSFLLTYHYLRRLGVSAAMAWQISVRVKRGLNRTATPGAFAKDAIYLRGYLELQKRLPLLSLPLLYVGRISWEDIDYLLNFPSFNPPRWLPSFIYSLSPLSKIS